MGTITTFFSTTPMALFVVPIILVIVVLVLVVANKTHKTEVITPMPTPPVTTVPQPEVTPVVTPEEIKAPVITPEKEIPMAPVSPTPPPTIPDPVVSLVIPSWRPSASPIPEDALTEVKVEEPVAATEVVEAEAALPTPPPVIAIR